MDLEEVGNQTVRSTAVPPGEATSLDLQSSVKIQLGQVGPGGSWFA